MATSIQIAIRDFWPAIVDIDGDLREYSITILNDRIIVSARLVDGFQKAELSRTVFEIDIGDFAEHLSELSERFNRMYP